MDSYVAKVQYNGSLRRLTLAGDDVSVFSFAELQSKTRELFQLPAATQIVLTYVDNDGDIVTMADDDDLRDAVVLQSLNPLRLSMTTLNESRATDVIPNLDRFSKQSSTPAERTTFGTSQPAESSVDTATNHSAKISAGDPKLGAEISTGDPELGAEISTGNPELGAEISTGDPELRVEDEVKTEDGTASKRVEPEHGAAEADQVVKTEDGTAAKIVKPEQGAADDKSAEAPADSAAGDGEQHDIHHGIRCDGCGMIPLVGPRFKSCKKANFDLCLRCFESSSESEQNEYVKIERRFYRLVHPGFVSWPWMMGFVSWPRMMRLSFALGSRDPYEGVRNSGDASGDARETGSASGETGKTASVTADKGLDPGSKVVHSGVQCDECGITPIEGPRFKSCIRFNYDVCLGCFERSGSNTREYTRIERPGACRGYPLGIGRMMRLSSSNFRSGPMCGRSYWVVSQMIPKDTSDESVADQKTTASAAVPEAVSTSSDVPAVPAAQADVLPSASEQVEVAKLEADALLSASEQVEVAEVEADALLSASEQVEMAEVEADVRPSASEHVEVAKVEGDTLPSASEQVKPDKVEIDAPPSVSEQAETTEEREVNVKDVDSDSNSSLKFDLPVENLSTEGSPVNNFDQNSESEDVEGAATEDDLSTVEGLLAKLGVMGFSDETLNRELLEKNKFDLRKTLDELCAAEEWDPILGDLQEMGFYDANMNRRLLFKNNGSVKRVVKELVQLTKRGKTKA